MQEQRDVYVVPPLGAVPLPRGESASVVGEEATVSSVFFVAGYNRDSEL